MFNTSLRILKDTAEAEDVMQESFLVAFHKLDRYSGEGTFGSWLKKIVINNALDHLRRRHEQTSIDEIGIDFPDEEDQETEEEIQWKVREIKQAINKLPEEYRTAVVLSDLEGLPYSEIAELMDVPVGTVKSRLFRGRRQLQKVLYDYAVEMDYIPAMTGTDE